MLIVLHTVLYSVKNIEHESMSFHFVGVLSLLIFGWLSIEHETKQVACEFLICWSVWSTNIRWHSVEHETKFIHFIELSDEHDILRCMHRYC